MKIAPYKGGDFDIHFLKPERVIWLIQAYTFARGDPVEINIGGIASVCSECTAMQGKPGYLWDARGREST